MAVLKIGMVLIVNTSFAWYRLAVNGRLKSSIMVSYKKDIIDLRTSGTCSRTRDVSNTTTSPLLYLPGKQESSNSSGNFSTSYLRSLSEGSLHGWGEATEIRREGKR
ncbi:hypothetical protein AVEN_174258-1 [Araneus ventricosus]|uniref:Uncharacterized protein n=1 Tax=Araneus ventricosus TaxID=182803 RepID=A0A4Y2NUG8_ARAVE|nr:hypothetical protein AVEN_174258-1 [Araneus ventricosus]